MSNWFVPEGWHTITPRIVVNDAVGLTEFIKHVFKATGDYRSDRPSVLTIGDSMVMVGDAGIREVCEFLSLCIRQRYRRNLPTSR